ALRARRASRSSPGSTTRFDRVVLQLGAGGQEQEVERSAPRLARLADGERLERLAVRVPPAPSLVLPEEQVGGSSHRRLPLRQRAWGVETKPRVGREGGGGRGVRPHELVGACPER